MFCAKGKEIGFVGDPPHGVQELGTNPLADEVRIFFDLLNSLGIGNMWIANRFIEIVNIGQHLTA